MWHRMITLLIALGLMHASMHSDDSSFVFSRLAAAQGDTPSGEVREPTGGVDDTAYTSPTFGYSLTWEGSWTVEEAWSEAGYDYLKLANEAGSIAFEAAADFGGDPAACLEFLVSTFRDDPATSRFVPVQPEGNQPPQDDAARATAAYVATGPFDDGSITDLVMHFECRTLKPGEAVLMITHFVLAEGAEEQAATRDELLANLQLQDAEPLPTEELEPTEAEANADIVRALYEGVYGGGDLALIDVLLAPDYVEHQTDVPLGREGMRRVVEALRAGFPDLTVTIDELTADSDKVWVLSTMRGTHQGELFGIPATGRTVEVGWFDVYQLAEGRIVAHWGVGDELGLMTQLGYTLVPPAADEGA